MSLLRTRLKMAAALRGQGKFDEANSLVEELPRPVSQVPRAPVREGMLLLEAEADAGKGVVVGGVAALGRARPEPRADEAPAGSSITTPGITSPWCSRSRKKRSRHARRSRA